MLAYFRLMVLNRLAAFKPKSWKRAGKSKVLSIVSFVGFALLGLFLYGTVVWLEMVMFDASLNLGDPKNILALVFLLSTIATLIYGFFNVVATLFFSKDNDFVAALPITSRGVLAAKLASVLLGEIGLTFAISLPLVIRYGVYEALGVTYYLRVVLGMLFIPMVPLAIATLLSFLLIRVSALWKRREGMTVVMSFLLVGAVVAVQMNLQMNMTDDQLTSMMTSILFRRLSLTDTLLSAYPPLGWLMNSLSGGGMAWLGGLMFGIVSLGTVTLVVWALGGKYLSLALKQEEIMRRVNAGRKKLGKDRTRTPFQALYRREMLDVISVPVYATNCLTSAIMFPLIIVIMMISVRQEIPDTNIMQFLLPLLPINLYLACATLGFSFTTVMSTAVSTAVTREGKQHDFRRVLPIDGKTHLMAKLAMGMTYNAFAMLLIAILLWVILPTFWVQTLGALVIAQLFSLMTCISLLLLDVYHPRLNWKTEAEAVKRSMNVLLGMLISLVQIAALFGVFMLCMKAGLSIENAVLIDVALLIAANAGLLCWLRGKAAVTYCLQEYAN